VLYTAYFAQNLILLLLLAGLVSLLLSPGVRALERFAVPRVLGATFLLACLIVPSTTLIMQLEEPITKWAKLLPQLSAHLTDQIEVLNQAIETSTKAEKVPEEKSSTWFSWFEKTPKPETPEKKPDMIESQLKESIFSFMADFMVTAPLVLMQFMTAIILIIFSLVYSPKLYQQYVKLFVNEHQQKRASQFALSAQRQLSRYIITVSIINLALSICALIFFSLLGLEDALLLALIVGFANFIPFVGPLFALSIISIAGFVQWGADINVAVAVGGVLTLNVIESQFLTPLALAKNMRINPFIIILWLLITGWLWGLIGVLIAVPLLVCVKLLLAQFKATVKWVEFLAT
jgi:predicted PurR-regulated permease PerM